MPAVSQDFSWLGPSAPTPPVYPEDELWSLVKSGHSARAVVVTMPHGQELRAEVDGSLIRARLFRLGESGLDAEAVEWRSAFEARGWTQSHE